MKLYDGKVLPGYTQDTVKELRKTSKREGLDGSRRATCRTRSANAWSDEAGEGTINRSWS